jgi:hypothetical protein
MKQFAKVAVAFAIEQAGSVDQRRSRLEAEPATSHLHSEALSAMCFASKSQTGKIYYALRPGLGL